MPRQPIEARGSWLTPCVDALEVEAHVWLLGNREHAANTWELMRMHAVLKCIPRRSASSDSRPMPRRGIAINHCSARRLLRLLSTPTRDARRLLLVSCLLPRLIQHLDLAFLPKHFPPRDLALAPEAQIKSRAAAAQPG